MIIVRDIEQGTDEWMALRTGIPTASNMDKVITSQAKKSTSAAGYMHTLVAEHYTGEKESINQTPAMLRGIEMEAEAREAFEFITDLEVEEVTFCYKDEDKMVGCSPDGIVINGTGELLEIKCPLPGTHVGYLLGNKVPTKYIIQVQSQIWVTGKPCYFMSYCPKLPPLIIKVEPDEKIQSAMDEIIPEFIGNMLDARKQLENL